MKYRYSGDFDPPAPVIELCVSAPLSKDEISLTALIDSGADITVIPERITTQLRLRRVDLLLASGFGASVIEAMVYSAILSVEGVLKPRIYRVLSWREGYVLLGRDLLNQLTTVLNGPNEELKLR